MFGDFGNTYQLAAGSPGRPCPDQRQFGEQVFAVVALCAAAAIQTLLAHAACNCICQCGYQLTMETGECVLRVNHGRFAVSYRSQHWSTHKQY
jgi:hypothetical protein